LIFYLSVVVIDKYKGTLTRTGGRSFIDSFGSNIFYFRYFNIAYLVDVEPSVFALFYSFALNKIKHFV